MSLGNCLQARRPCPFCRVPEPDKLQQLGGPISSPVPRALVLHGPRNPALTNLLGGWLSCLVHHLATVKGPQKRCHLLRRPFCGKHRLQVCWGNESSFQELKILHNTASLNACSYSYVDEFLSESKGKGHQLLPSERAEVKALQPSVRTDNLAAKSPLCAPSTFH